MDTWVMLMCSPRKPKVIAGVRDGLCDSRGVVGIGAGVRFGGLDVTGGSDRDNI
jgi:hypothetical protein